METTTMETTIKNFIIYVSTITSSLTYCYYISSTLPKGLTRLISLIPIIILFTLLPLTCTSIFTTAITASFTTWLTNFKLIRFAFDLDHSPFHPSYSLIRFITFTSLPIKTKPTDHSLQNNHLFKLRFQFPIFLVLVTLVLKHVFYPTILLLIYCVMLFLIIDIITAIFNVVLILSTGLELEPSSDHPYMSTSLQDFWGRWNLMVTTTLRYTVYKPIRSMLSNYKWAPLVGVFASFIVSGLMHELFVYQLSRVAPTWEMTWFFVIHGVCVVVEMVVKRHVSLRLPGVVTWMLTMGFVVSTGMWLFFPPLVRNGLDVKILEEYTLVIDFIKAKFFMVVYS